MTQSITLANALCDAVDTASQSAYEAGQESVDESVLSSIAKMPEVPHGLDIVPDLTDRAKLHMQHLQHPPKDSSDARHYAALERELWGKLLGKIGTAIAEAQHMGRVNSLGRGKH